MDWWDGLGVRDFCEGNTSWVFPGWNSDLDHFKARAARHAIGGQSRVGCRLILEPTESCDCRALNGVYYFHSEPVFRYFKHMASMDFALSRCGYPVPRAMALLARWGTRCALGLRRCSSIETLVEHRLKPILDAWHSDLPKMESQRERERDD